MKYLISFLFIIFLFLGSCKKGSSTSSDVMAIDSLARNKKRIVHGVGEVLVPKAKKDFEKWNEYNDLDEFILTYYNITISQALNNSEELAGLVKLVKDSVRVEIIDRPNVIARFNVLYNETLRLSDMATIPSIEDAEVEEEVHQILDIYAAVNAKINTIYKAIELQEALEIDTEIPVEIIDEKQPFLKPQIGKSKVSAPKNKSNNKK